MTKNKKSQEEKELSAKNTRERAEKAIKNRYDFLYFFDVTDANPNGDPDAGNMPRIDAETGRGLVTDVMLKRKIRNYVALTKEYQPPFDIYVKERTILNHIQESVIREKTGASSEGKELPQYDPDDARGWMCDRFYDIRTFGGVLSIKPNCGQVRGPAQLSFGRSVDRIASENHAITRVARASEDEASQSEKGEKTNSGGMGNKWTVPYALYRIQGTVNAKFAQQTGFDETDLKLLWTSLTNAFENDASAARPPGSIVPRFLLIFKHASDLGNAPSWCLFDRLQIKPFEQEPAADGKPPRSFADYAGRVTFDGQPIDAVVKAGEQKDVGNGVTLMRRV